MSPETIGVPLLKDGVKATSSTDADPISEWTADANREEPSALNPPVAEVGAQKLQVSEAQGLAEPAPILHEDAQAWQAGRE
eukprot:4832231-Amphidinium_carterae.1